MPNQFNQSQVQQYGGVAWAKQQIEQLDPGAIQDQINGYNQVNSSLNQIIQTLNTSNASLQSAWAGDAATAAAQSFTDTSNHTQNVVSTVNNTIAQLNQAKAAAQTAKAAMAKVPNEKPVPAGNWLTNGISDLFTGTDPAQQAQQHNTTVRTQAADVINQLSNSYDAAATNLSSISTNDYGSGFNPTSPPATGTYNLGAGSYGGGSGAAASYASTTHAGGRAGGVPEIGPSGTVTGGVFHDSHTSLQGVSTVPPATSGVLPETGPLAGTATTPVSEPILGGIGGPLSNPAADEGKLRMNGEGGLLGEGGANGEANGLSSRSSLRSSGVFGEDGFGSEGGATASRSSSLGNVPAEGEGFGSGAAAGDGQGQIGMRGMVGGRRGTGAGGEEEELGSSRYTRGRYFGGEEPGSGRDEWVQPSIGGDESLIVRGGARGAGPGRVTSAYDGATDAEGNPIGHRMGFVGRRDGSSTEEEERGERPAYLKEDPEWWKSAQRVAPPVIE
jgi:uncharacterized protein YukE